MNHKLIFKIIANLLYIIALFMILPIMVAIYYNEIDELKYFVITIGAIAVIASLILILSRSEKRSNLSIRDGFLLVAISWISASIFSAFPFYLSEQIPSFIDAFFETISGFTTTGASILTNIEGLSKSMLFWRSLTHWLGGMGIVVLAVAILPLLGIGGLELMKAEAPGPSVDKITPRITETAKILWFIYLGFTLAETILLMIGGMNLFDSLTHTFGTLATGGFSPKNNSIAHYNSTYIDIIITFFMIMAGVNFTLHFRLLTGRINILIKDTEFIAYISIFISATILITYDLYGQVYDTIGKSIRFASFQAASILTTTGYASTDFEQWPSISKAVLFALMFVGGCAGSTGGGIKVIRIVSLFKYMLTEMKYIIHPRGIFTTKIRGNIIKKDIMHAISSFFFLYIFILLIVTVIVSTSGQDLLTSITTSLAMLGNIGPGFGDVGPSDNFSFYPNYIKCVLCIAMIVGRLELYTILIIFFPAFWKK